MFQGRSFAPDALLTQEFADQAAVDSMVAILNSAQEPRGLGRGRVRERRRRHGDCLLYRTGR